MQISRYLDVEAFRKEADKLKVVTVYLDKKVFERLERQRSLMPRLRLHYPDEIERRWFADGHPEMKVGGAIEPDGPRWDNASALEKARHHERWDDDPTIVRHPLDDPEPRFLPFIERPNELPFVPWQDYRVAVNAEGAEPLYKYDTEVAYYSSWQLLQFAEVVNMGVTSYLNLLSIKGWPSKKQIAEAPAFMSFLPGRAMRGFAEHERALDAMVWFAEEASKGYHFATRDGNGHRRLLTETESEEIMRTRLWAAAEAQRLHGVGPTELLAAIRFLCGQWDDWNGNGRPLIADAYKAIAAQGVRLACLATNVTVDEYRVTVGRVGGHFKPILDVIWPDWAREQREDIRLILTSYRRESSLLNADFSDELVDRFLDFIEANDLHGFYWRMDSFHRHAFKGNDHALEGLKGDVQGMAVVLEHIVSALGSSRTQLMDKFKEVWSADPPVLKLLKDNKVMKIGLGKTIDLDWFEARNVLSLPEQTAADLAISHAIRGGAHRVIEETNPLKLERMILILLRAAVKTFDAATKSKKGSESEPPHQHAIENFQA